MIVVGHENHGLLSQFRIAAGEQPENVGRLYFANVARECCGEVDAQRHGPKVALLGRGAELIQILAGQSRYPP